MEREREGETETERERERETVLYPSKCSQLWLCLDKKTNNIQIDETEVNLVLSCKLDFASKLYVLTGYDNIL